MYLSSENHIPALLNFVQLLLVFVSFKIQVGFMLQGKAILNLFYIKLYASFSKQTQTAKMAFYSIVSNYHFLYNVHSMTRVGIYQIFNKDLVKVLSYRGLM